MDADTIMNYAGFVIGVLALIFSKYKSYEAGKAAAKAAIETAQSLIILVNTLKDETKMIDGQFAAKTLQKAEEMAMTIGADDLAVEQVKKALTGKELNLQLASWKGKPIYLSDLLKFGGIAQGLGKLFRR